MTNEEAVSTLEAVAERRDSPHIMLPEVLEAIAVLILALWRRRS